jgi:Flp pilus assembly pilin Flp
MFSIEYINIPTLIAILVIAYLMDDVFLFMKLGNDTTKQLMATVVGYVIAVRISQI